MIAFGAIYFKPWQSQATETITVSAEGKAQATPNIAKLSATVSTTNDNLDLAREQNEEKVNKLITALKNLGTEEKDIKTQYITGGETYQIQENESRPGVQVYPPPQKKTNQVSTTFEITIRDFTKADEILAAFTQNGAANLYGPNLTLDENAQETAKSQARQKAVESARKKAEELAKLSGRKLGKPTSIKEQGEPIYPGPIFAQSESDLKQRASQIVPGQNEVTINLQVEFELK